jgi:hypothetical protein
MGTEAEEVENIDGLFEGDDEETTEVETEVEAKVEEPSTEEPTEPTTEEQDKRVPIAALLDERSKRQALEDKVSDLESRIPVVNEEPDPIIDPEDYKKYVRQQVESDIAKDNADKWTAKVEASRSTMLETEADYEEMESGFMTAVKVNPDLQAKMNAEPDPAKFAYEEGKKYLLGLAKRFAPKDETKVTETEEPALKLVKTPNLAKATAQAPNSVAPEVEETVDEMFEDQKY